jgi:hypothetical protein
MSHKERWPSIHAARRRTAVLLLFLVVVGLVTFATHARGAELRLTLQSGQPDGSVEALIDLASRGEAISGVQLDVMYDPDRMTIAVEGAAALAEQGKVLLTSSPDRGIVRLLIIGDNANPMLDAPFVSLKLTAIEASPNAPPQLQILNAVATSPEGQNIDVTTSQAWL